MFYWELERRVATNPRENLPSFLSRAPDGRLKVNPEFVEDGGKDSYDEIRDFDHTRDSLLEEVPPEERIISNRPDLEILELTNAEIAAAMEGLTDLANDSGKSFDNSADRKQYRDFLKPVYTAVATRVREKVGREKVLYLPPKNGGIYVADVFMEKGVSPEDIYDYRMSRILGKDGRLMVGVTFGRNNQQIADFRNFAFVDDCMASDISGHKTLEYVRGQLLVAHIDPKEAKVIIGVSVPSQRGLESILSPETKAEFGFGSLEAVVARKPVPKMTPHFYLQNADGRLSVGDMGKWTIKP